jgi:hypothetical protein
VNGDRDLMAVRSLADLKPMETRVMKVVTLKNIPIAPAEGAADVSALAPCQWRSPALMWATSPTPPPDPARISTGAAPTRRAMTMRSTCARRVNAR